MLNHLSIPSTPPEFTRQDESAGLALLDLGLNMGHVSRVTEGLVLVEEGSLRRSVAVDVDCKALDVEHTKALRVRETTNHEADLGFLWLPIMRHSRQDLAPVLVRDAAGDITTTLTHRVAVDATVAGLTRLFKLMVTSTSDWTLHPRAEPNNFEAVWLLATCIRELIEQGTDVTDDPLAGQGTKRGLDRQDDEAREGAPSVRRAATRLWDSLAGSDVQESFLELLEVARSEYWIIAALPEGRRHHHLEFEAPLLRDSSEVLGRGDRFRRRVFGTGEYTVRYTTELPRGISSYHVTVQVPEELKVRRFILSSDADTVAVEEISRDAAALADVAESVSADPRDPRIAVCKAEEQAIKSRLRVIVDRREAEFREYVRYFHSETKAHTAHSIPSRLLSRSVVSPPWPHSSRSHAASLGALTTGMRGLVRYVETHELGKDVIVENDPRENGAHAQWRRRPLPFGTKSLTPMRASVWLTLSDEEPALIDSVRHMIVALLAVVIGIVGVLGVLTNKLPKEGGDPPQADALVAVLLIVPGILLTRLDIPQTNTVLGVLRRLPRNVAYASVVVTSALAVFIAPSGSDEWDLIACAVAVALLMLLWIPLGLEKRSRDRDRLRPVPQAVEVSAWLREGLERFGRSRPSLWMDSRGIRRDTRTHGPDAVFEAVRPRSTVEGETRPAGSGGRAARRGVRRRAAELAGFGSRAVVRASDTVHFEVRHWVGPTRAPATARTAGYLVSVQPQATSTETSFFDTRQVAVEVVVNSRSGGSDASSSNGSRFDHDIGNGLLFTGDVKLRPVPNLAGKPSIDLLIQLPDDNSLLPTLCEVLGTSSSDCGRRPILPPGTALSSVRYPESTGYRNAVDENRGAEDPQWPPAVRLALSLPESTKSVRANTLAHIAEVVRDMHGGLLVGAAHAHARRLEWSSVVDGPQRSSVMSGKPSAPGALPSSSGPPLPGAEMLVTFLGSARGGQLDLVRDILSALQARAHAKAVALTTSQQYVQATLHLQRVGAGDGWLMGKPPDTIAEPKVMLTDMFGHRETWEEVVQAGFKVLMSEVCQALRNVDLSAPLWVLWEGPPCRRQNDTATGTGLPLIAVMQALRRRDHPCVVQQLRTRYGPGGACSARALLAVSSKLENRKDVENLDDFGRLAKAVEDEVGSLCVESGLARHRFRLRVVVREWWL